MPRAVLVRSNPSASTPAVRRRQLALGKAVLRRSRARVGIGGKMADLERAKDRALAVLARRWKAPQRRNPPRGWRRSSEAAKHRQWKLSAAIKRRTAAERRRGQLSGGLSPRLAAMHAAYARARDVEARRSAREAAIERRERSERKRRKNPMTKKQRAAVRKMQAGLRRWKAAKRRRSSSSKSSRRRRNTSRGGRGRAVARRLVQHAMTRIVPVPVAALVRNPRRKRKGSPMAKRRRRRHRRNNPPMRRSRRRHHHRRRRSNPGGMGGALRSVTAAFLPAAIGGVAAGLLDATLLGGRPMLMRIGAKVVTAGIGGAFLRKNPVRSAAFVGAMIGTGAYEGGVRLAGGLVAHNKPAGMKELAGMAAEDEASLGLLQEELRGLGLLEEDRAQGMGDLEPNLGDAEPNLGDEEMADIGDEYE